MRDNDIFFILIYTETDGVISRRNRAFHPVSVQVLVELRNECIILDDYDGMKSVFPVL